MVDETEWVPYLLSLVVPSAIRKNEVHASTSGLRVSEFSGSRNAGSKMLMASGLHPIADRLAIQDPYQTMTKNPKTILVIDDEESQRETLSEILSRAGFRVLTGGGYADGVSLYQQYGPEIALLLVDVSLPQENGFELAKVLCRIEPGLRVLFMSGGVGAELCRFYGISASTAGNLLAKPVASGSLLRKVRQMLGVN